MEPTIRKYLGEEETTQKSTLLYDLPGELVKG